MEKSRELLDKYNAEAIFVDSDKNVYVTDGIKFELKNTKEYSYKDF
jgi:thiamine biosynthesis lipoprotein